MLNFDIARLLELNERAKDGTLNDPLERAEFDELDSIARAYLDSLFAKPLSWDAIHNLTPPDPDQDRLDPQFFMRMFVPERWAGP